MQYVEVTQDDIDNSLQRTPFNCAIARALKKRMRTGNVVVNGGPLFQVDGVDYRMPSKGQQFVRKFDASRSMVSPFTFALRRHKQTQTEIDNGLMYSLITFK
jgi:hypothetical protein